MPRKFEQTVYSFDELSPEAQERAISDFKDSGAYWTDDDMEELTENFRQDLEDLGLPHKDVRVSVGFVQGDGVAFYGDLDLGDYIEKNKLTQFEPLLNEGLKVSIKKNWDLRMYDHAYTMEVETDAIILEDPRKLPKSRKRWAPGHLILRFEDHLKEHIQSVSHDLYGQASNEILDAGSDEAIRERLEESSREYTEDGRRYRR